ncbi:MAG: hydroxymethylbilane synthase [Paenibacillus sp. RIFOXYA1_FULL_44_5]|nr:MAG: hydroxymethylbilane synthase [Paenibacillus sp. RIFOXYA1_FULL_44_5]
MRKIIVGTRQSALALTQTMQVIDSLRKVSEERQIACEFEIKKIVTRGDRILDVTLSKVGGKGLFVKEIEQALLDGEIDMAVHSMKDMPSKRQDGLMVGAVPRRVDPRDALIMNSGLVLEDLPKGARVGTSSLRRAAQLKAFRPDLEIESIRGNIDSRLNKLQTEGFDAIVLAAAGLIRMGWMDRITSYVSTDRCVPAVGQGALGIECRADDLFMLELLGMINDAHTFHAVAAERSFLESLDGGCQIPMGAYAEIDDKGNKANPFIRMTGIVGAPDGSQLLKETLYGDKPEQLGKQLANMLLQNGAEEILTKYRE